MSCLACGRTFHDECLDIVDSTCCCRRRSTHEDTDRTTKHNIEHIGDADTPRPRGRPHKNDADLEDPHSSWRRRASVAFPLDKEQPCEWRNLKNVGGGKYPIVGCASGMQSAIHHGPVKITIGYKDEEGNPFDFNREGNVHRICGRCHNLWHHWNDAPYDATEWAGYAHTPTDATPHELLQWANSHTRPKPPFPRTGPRKLNEE